MGEPTSQSGNCIQYGEHIGGKAHPTVYQTRIEVHVWVQLTSYTVNKQSCTSSHLEGQFAITIEQFQLVAPYHTQKIRQSPPTSFTAYLLHNFGPWVEVFIYSISKAIKRTLFKLDFHQKTTYAIFCADLFEHVDDCGIGSSVFGAVEGASRQAYCGIQVHSSTGQMPDKGSRAPHFVFCMNDEQDLKCTYQFGVWLEIALVESVHHVQEVGSIPETLLWLVKLPPQSLSISQRCQSWHYTQQPVYLLIAEGHIMVRLFIRQRFCLWMLCGKCTNGGNEHAHGVSIKAEGPHQLQRVSMDSCMGEHLIGEF